MKYCLSQGFTTFFYISNQLKMIATITLKATFISKYLGSTSLPGTIANTKPIVPKFRRYKRRLIFH